MGSRIEAGAGDDRRPPLGDLDRQGDQALLLLFLERRALAGRTDRHETVGPLPELPGDVFLKGGFIHRAIAERGDQRDERPLEHRFLPNADAA